ncbi:hypothetical protein MTO96_012049 [Rhipicephalus appendiculatus]
MATKYNIGDPVWAKMKGFSPWPGKVANPTKEVKRPALKKPMHCIFFFGTNNYAWIQEDQIKPYEASKGAIMSKTFQNNRPIANTPTKGSPSTRVAASEDEVEEAPATPAVTPSKTPKTPKEPKEPVTADKEPKRRKRASQDQSHRASKRTSSESSSTGSAPMKRNKAAATDKASSVATATPNNNAAGLNSVSNATSSSKSSSNLLRQSYVTRPVTPPLDVERISDVLRSKHVSPSNLKFGFLGLGNMGQGMVKNLINSGHHITVWNRTPSKVWCTFYFHPDL